jgi:Icc protein
LWDLRPQPASQEIRNIQTSTPPVRILHVTDPHLFADADSSLRGTVTDVTLKAVLDHFQQSGWPADLVAMTGDVIQDDTAAAYDRFVKLMEPLGLPVYCVPGNHDVRALMREALSTPPFYYCESVTIRNWLVTGIDSCLRGEAGGRISDAELSRLDALLEQTTAEHVAICLHHPPLPMNSKWLDQVGLRNARDFLDLVGRAAKVRTTLFGHVHQAFDETYESIRIIGTPSTCRQFKPGSADFALDERPPAYRRVELFVDGSVESELVWVNCDG